LNPKELMGSEMPEPEVTDLPVAEDDDRPARRTPDRHSLRTSMTYAHDVSRHIVRSGFGPGYTIDPIGSGQYEVTLLVGSPSRPIDNPAGRAQFVRNHLPELARILSTRFEVQPSGDRSLLVRTR
jgi:hypothetical protein